MYFLAGINLSDFDANATILEAKRSNDDTDIDATDTESGEKWPLALDLTL